MDSRGRLAATECTVPATSIQSNLPLVIGMYTHKHHADFQHIVHVAVVMAEMYHYTVDHLLTNIQRYLCVKQW